MQESNNLSGGIGVFNGITQYLEVADNIQIE